MSSPSKNKTDNKTLELNAASKFKSGSYKEAIELYKTLLKTAQNPEWQQTLADCYLQRALSFAAKGMLKEAAVLWESYNQHNNKRDYFDQYLFWQLQGNDTNKIKKYLQQLTIQQLDESYPQLASILGLLILTNKPELQATLPQDSLFIKHLKLAQAALASFKDGQQPAVEAQLQQVPFRSAFKDFKILLKAALTFSESPQDAKGSLEKIAVESPYRLMADSLLACHLNGAALIKSLEQLSYKQAQLISSAKKFNKPQTELLDVLAKQKGPLSDKLKFGLALQYRILFGETLVKRYCYSALANYSAGQRDFNKQFGQPDEFEEYRLKALSYERKGELNDALYYWKRCATWLQNQPTPDNLKIALLLRHIASKEEPSKRLSWWEDSLGYDPDDRETYLKIINHCENTPNQGENFSVWLNNSLEKFPQDIELLQIGIKEAVRQQTLDKAKQYAQTILKIDPLNGTAKQALFAIQAAAVRHLVKSKNYGQLETELQSLQGLALNKRDQFTATLLNLFCAYAKPKADKAQTASEIVNTLQRQYPGLVCIHFYALLEASLIGLPLATLSKNLPALANTYAMPSNEVSAFSGLVMEFQNRSDTQPLVFKLLDKLKAPIKYSVSKKRHPEMVLLAFCQCMEAVNHITLLRACVDAIPLKWKEAIWVYYRVYVTVNGDAKKCGFKELMTLRMSLQRAVDEDDHRTTAKIERFLNTYKNHIIGSEFDEDDVDFDEDFDNPLELLEDLPDDIYHKIGNHGNLRVRKMGLERLVVHLVNYYYPDDDGSIKKWILNDLVALQVLNMMKSAEELGIPVDCDAEDLLDYMPDENDEEVPSAL